VFRSLTLHELGRSDAAMAALLATLAQHDVGDLDRYRAAASGNAEFLLERDRRTT
jgi:hypothetical protein